GLLLEHLHRYGEAADAFARVVRDYEEARKKTREPHLTATSVKTLRQWRDGVKAEAEKPSFIRVLSRAGLFLELGDIGEAFALLEEALPAAKTRASAEDPKMLKLLTESLLAHAAACSLLSAGYRLPGTKREAVDEKEAEELRGKAFVSLESALDHGGENLDKIRSDPRLNPLRVDPRFSTLIGRPRSRGGK
ncbi:MAG: hypothetical protein ACYTFG_12875, partial [Planctomycetota bacterium]